MRLALLLTRMSPSPDALRSETTSITDPFAIRVRSQGASVSILENTTFSAPTSLSA